MVFIPNYLYIPPEILQKMKLKNTDIDELPHVQQLLWSRIKEAQANAFLDRQFRWQLYYSEHQYLAKSPFAVRFRTQTSSDRIIIHFTQVVQHMRAHEVCIERGGPQNLSVEEFYDWFIRPLEFMVAPGMPLHSLLNESVHHYASRCNLFKLLLETAGFSIYDPVPVQQHMVFSELTRIRHLNASNLIPIVSNDAGPFVRLDRLPRITYINRTKPNSKIIEPKDFAPGGKYETYKPHPFVPLPDRILDEFKKLGGKHMAFCDEFALHTNFLKTHKQYVVNKYPAQEKEKLQQQKNLQPPPIVSNSPKRIDKKVENITQDPKVAERWNEMMEEFKETDKQAIHTEQVERPASAQQVNPPPLQAIPLPQPNEVIPEPKKPSIWPPGPRLSIFQPPDFSMFQVVNALPTEITEQYTNQIIMKQCMAQLEQKLLQQQQQMLQNQSLTEQQRQVVLQQVQEQQTRPDNTIMSTQDWEFSQSQPPQGHSMFPQTQSQEYTKVGTAQSSTGNQVLPNPVYHPSISPTPKPPMYAEGASNYPTPAYHPTIENPYVPSSREIQMEKIFPGSLLWSSTGHFRAPLWTKMAHSAFTLYELIDVTGITEEEKSRHIEMPHFRQIPVDGINFGHTMSIYLSKMDKTEVILIKVSSVKFYQHSKRQVTQYKPVEHQMIIPTYAYARFILMFCEVAKTVLPPAMMDVREGNYELLSKQAYISHDYVDIKIKTSEAQNGIERIVSMTMDDERKTKTPKPVTFPWIHMGKVLIAMRRVHEDLKQTGYI